MRSRVDQLARLNGLSRHSFLVFVLLTLAARDATGGTESVLAAVEAAGGEPPRPPSHQRSLSGP